MMTVAEARALRKQHLDALKGWQEPDGHLVPTETDPEIRASVRAGLQAAIETLNRVLGGDGAGDEVGRPPLRRVSVHG